MSRETLCSRQVASHHEDVSSMKESIRLISTVHVNKKRTGETNEARDVRRESTASGSKLPCHRHVLQRKSPVEALVRPCAYSDRLAR